LNTGPCGGRGKLFLLWFTKNIEGIKGKKCVGQMGKRMVWASGARKRKRVNDCDSDTRTEEGEGSIRKKKRECWWELNSRRAKAPSNFIAKWKQARDARCRMETWRTTTSTLGGEGGVGKGFGRKSRAESSPCLEEKKIDDPGN